MPSNFLSSPTSPVRHARQTPLPFAQIAVLMGVRLAEPIAYTVIFPFVNQMVEELGVTDNPDRVGFYSGLVESVFAFVQFFTVYHWAKMSDKIGRKPVILFGLVGVAISGSLFGLANSFWMMIFFRCMSGAVNGNVAVIRAAIGDITDSSNSTEAFAMYGMTWTVGAILGNGLGGLLSHPYERFPNWFGSFEIFKVHPYLLPCLVCAGATLLGILFCVVFYQESLPSLANHSRLKTRRSLSFSIPFARPASGLVSGFLNTIRPSLPRSVLRLTSAWPLTTPRSMSMSARHKRQYSTSSLLSEAETLVDPNEASSRKLLSGQDEHDTYDKRVEEEEEDADVNDQSRSPSAAELSYQYSSTDIPTGARPGSSKLVSSGSMSGRGEWGFWELMRFRKVKVMAATGFLNAFVGGAWAAASLLFFFDRNNGLGMSASAIGAAFAINGVWTIVCQLLLLHRIRRWLGIATGYKVLSVGWIFVWLFLPMLRNVLIATEDPISSSSSSSSSYSGLGTAEKVQYSDTRGWQTSICVNLYLSFVTVVNMTGSLLMVLINLAAPDKSALGAINGIGTAVGCMARVIGPSLISALFAYSMDTMFLGGRAWWMFMILMSMVNFVVSNLVESESEPQFQSRSPSQNTEVRYQYGRADQQQERDQEGMGAGSSLGMGIRGQGPYGSGSGSGSGRGRGSEMMDEDDVEMGLLRDHDQAVESESDLRSDHDAGLDWNSSAPAPLKRDESFDHNLPPGESVRRLEV